MAGSKRFYFKTVSELIDVLTRKVEGGTYAYLDTRKIIIEPSPLAQGEYVVRMIKKRKPKA